MCVYKVYLVLSLSLSLSLSLRLKIRKCVTCGHRKLEGYLKLSLLS